MAHGDVLCTLLISSEMSLSKGSFSCASEFISAVDPHTHLSEYSYTQINVLIRYKKQNINLLYKNISLDDPQLLSVINTIQQQIIALVEKYMGRNLKILKKQIQHGTFI